MLVEEWRPKLYCKKYECQNLSPDGKVFFIEDGHKYYFEDDIVKGKLIPFEETKFKFRSPTGILAEFKEKFDTEKVAKKYVEKNDLDITWDELAQQWADKGTAASEEGTILHAYAESKWNGWDMPKPNLVKAPLVEQMYEELSNSFSLARTELLVYSSILRLAGQVDLLLKNDEGKYLIMDYKFLKESLKYKSFFNSWTRKYKMMSGPFKHLMDCNYNHYSIQMEIYRYLMGKKGSEVVGKILIVVTPEEVSYIEGNEIKIWVSKSGILHARYKDYKGKLYDSSKDKEYLKNNYKII